MTALNVAQFAPTHFLSYHYCHLISAKQLTTKRTAPFLELNCTSPQIHLHLYELLWTSYVFLDQNFCLEFHCNQPVQTVSEFLLSQGIFVQFHSSGLNRSFSIILQGPSKSCISMQLLSSLPERPQKALCARRLDTVDNHLTTILLVR